MALTVLLTLMLYSITCISGEQWTIQINIDGRKNSDSGNTFYLDVDGTEQDRNGINLGNNFHKNEHRIKRVNANFGKINKIRIFQHDDDGLYVNNIVMSVGSRHFNFDCHCWIETDENKPSWTLYTSDCYWSDLLPHCTHMAKISCQTGRCTECELGYYLTGNICTACPSLRECDGHGSCSAPKGTGLHGTIQETSRHECKDFPPPHISTCRLMAVSALKEQAISLTSTSSECSNQLDFYGKFQVTRMVANISVYLHEGFSSSTNFATIPLFKFGVTDVSLEVIKKSLSGVDTVVKRKTLRSSTVEHPVADLSFNEILDTDMTAGHMENGERMCMRYSAKSGGYFVYKNLHDGSLRRVLYLESPIDHDVCYYLDNSPPVHCSDNKRNSACLNDPVNVPTKVMVNPEVVVSYDGWQDPSPVISQVQFASQIKSSALSLHEVTELDPSLLSMRPSSVVQLKNTTTPTMISIPKDIVNPALYAIVLEVTDVAGNVKQARKFILYDNSSEIVTGETGLFKASTATIKTAYIWQNDLRNLCFTWKGFFSNIKLNRLLRPIKADAMFTGSYEQLTGFLPINGTRNVNGIIAYNYTLVKNGKILEENKIIRDIESENVCFKKRIDDGDTFELNVVAMDIADHTRSNSTVVHIDSSVPEINNIWLTRDGYKGLYVHNSTDLSTMTLHFRAFDVHSGIRTIQWAIGTEPGKMDIGGGHIGTRKQEENTTCADEAGCYCPAVGACENLLYNISLFILKTNNTEMGLHNRRYHFTLSITNMAMLTEVQHLDVMVDDSPPRAGVVMEGGADELDLDYTSNPQITVHWSGFIDHESGIKVYRVGVAEKCLTISDINSKSNTNSNKTLYEVTTLFTKVTLVHKGKQFVTVIAYNHAMEPSSPACSDGIVFDDTYPQLENVSLHDSSIADSIGCYNGSAWLIFQSGVQIQKKNLHNECSNVCNDGNTHSSFIAMIPTADDSYFSDRDISDFICDHVPVYNDTIIYLPTDSVNITWNIQEDFSQIQDVFVGIGSNRNSRDSPDIVRYQNSKYVDGYEAIHSGLPNGAIFYLFIKVINKANLDNIFSYGPVMIDQTPPICPTTLPVRINTDYIQLIWNQSLFTDLEQKEEIGSIMFRIGFSSTFVTPFLQWHKDLYKCGDPNKRCITYPISRLRSQSADDTHMLYFQLHVYNYAGHYCTVTSETFQLTPRDPPGSAVVFDIDPQYKSLDQDNLSQDIDVSTAITSYCARWKGFKHHKQVTFEIGLGKAVGTDDVIPFHSVGITNEICENTTKMWINTKYIITVKARCEGGTSISSSDGFFVTNEKEMSKALHVHNGKSCYHQNRYNLNHTVNHGRNVFTVENELVSGKLYSIQCNYTKKLLADNAIIIPSTYNSSVAMFISLSPNPVFYLNTSFTGEISISECLDDVEYAHTDNSISISWNWENKELKKYCVYYRVRLYSLGQRGRKDIVHLDKSTSYRYTIPLKLSAGKYIASVSPCTNEMCFQEIFTNGFTVSNAMPVTRNVTSQKSRNGSSIISKINFVPFTCSLGNGSSGAAVFYRWGISLDNMAGKMICDWRIIQPPTDSSSEIQDSISIAKITYLHAHTYACIQGFCLEGTSVNLCVSQTTAINPNRFGNNFLYEVDPSKADLIRIKDSIFSAHIGHNLVWLQDNELDYISSGKSIAGILVGIEDKLVSWFLVTKPLIPTIDCSKTDFCIDFKQTSSGYQAFNTFKLRDGVIYYICAAVYDTTIGIDNHTENQKIFSVCGDGISIDNTPPTKGAVTIRSTNGYITNPESMLIEWKGFSDSSNYETLGYLSGIASFAYSLGTYPYSSDVIQVTSVGLSQTVLLTNLSLHQGFTYYATIKAEDQAGHTTLSTSNRVTLDYSAPLPGSIYIGKPGTHSYVIDASWLTIHWSGFHDQESGIKRFELGIGSSIFGPDVIPFSQHEGNYAALTVNDVLHDGHTYFVLIKTTNNAGLSTVTASNSFVVDSSPPTVGFVMDTLNLTLSDQDYQTNTTHIGCSWYGFDDPHTGIHHFSVALGTQPRYDDIILFTDSGKLTNQIWTLSLTPGLRYFCTVKACNIAGLCTLSSSNGIIVDNSPPIAGIVRVGINGRHAKYIPKMSAVQARWIGFQDPQSDLSHYEACIGTEPHAVCDITLFRSFLLSSSMTITGLNLPTKKPLYVTVRAFNRIGMFAEKSSDSFVVDISPPVIAEAPRFETNNGISSHSNDTQFDPSVLRLKWKFCDAESPIVRQRISLRTHHEGHTPVENFEMGSGTALTLAFSQRNLMHNGDKYVAEVTACNQAGHCSTANTTQILVDSSPPQIGGFMLPLTWHTVSSNITVLLLTWYGFTDPESNIKKYFIGVGTSYSGSDLSNGILPFYHIGGINEPQNCTVNVSRAFSSGEKIVLSLWATNAAGLSSAIARTTVGVISTSSARSEGILEIEKHSCIPQYCEGDCTCAVVGKKCQKAINITSCQELTGPGLDVFTVEIVSDMSVNMSASGLCLTAFWKSVNTTILSSVARFEWSAGRFGYPVGTDIFDTTTQNPWHDVGKQMSVTHCLNEKSSLESGSLYMFYVKAWFSMNTYKTYHSPAVTIDTSPPNIATRHAIKDSIDDCRSDMDFLKNVTYPITACWDKVFTDLESNIDSFTVQLGTSPGGSDVYEEGSIKNTRYTFSNLTLIPGTKYFLTVICFNRVRLSTSASSDGFLIDTEIPYSGVVYNTKYYHNVPHQTGTRFGLSFQGFGDSHSYIKKYLVSILQEMITDLSDVSFIDIGIQTSVLLPNVILTDGKTYYWVVKGVDAAGHETEPIMSLPFQVDRTPPCGFRCKAYTTQELTNESISSSHHGQISWRWDFDIMDVRLLKLKVKLFNFTGQTLINIQTKTDIRFLTLAQNKDGTQETEYRLLLKPLHQEKHFIYLEVNDASNFSSMAVSVLRCNEVEISASIKEPVFARQISPYAIAIEMNVIDIDSGIKHIYVGAGTTKNGYQLKSLTMIPSNVIDYVLNLQVGHGTSVYITLLTENMAGGKKHFYSNSIEYDLTPPVVENITVAPHYISFKNEVVTNLDIKWKAHDKQSTIKTCFFAVGFSDDTENALEWKEATKFKAQVNATFHHGAVIFVKVLCRNSVELEVEVVSKPLTISYKPPDGSGSKLNFNTGKFTQTGKAIQPHQSYIDFSWTSFVDRSGIKRYEYRLTGESRWTMSGLHQSARVTNLVFENGKEYMVEVRAMNYGGIYSNTINNTIIILNQAPELTGSAILTKTINTRLELDWRGVFHFDKRLDHHFILSIGSRYGTTDILPVHYTTDHFVSINRADLQSEMVVVIRAGYDTDMTTVYVERIYLP